MRDDESLIQDEVVLTSEATAKEFGSSLLEPQTLSESLRSDTERMRADLHLKRTQLRVLLSDTLVKRSLPVLGRLLEEAEQGKLRAADSIKLLDLLMKYSVGMIQSTEISGEDGAAVKVQYMFGTTTEGKSQALYYIESLRKQYKPEDVTEAEFTETSINDLNGSDNDSSDVSDLS